MKFFKSIFSRKHQVPLNAEKNTHSDRSFEVDVNAITSYAKKAIELLGTSDGTLEDYQILELFKSNGFPEEISAKLLVFLPITFVRCWLPDVAWLETYEERFDDGELIRRRYDESSVYISVMSVANEYFKDYPDPDTIIKIGGRSAEFHVLNTLLKGGGKLSDVRLTETIIVW